MTVLDALLERDFSAQKRREAERSGAAMKGGRFPIEKPEDVDSAVKLARTPEERAHVKRRAKAIGAQGKIPDKWKAAEAEEERPSIVPLVEAFGGGGPFNAGAHPRGGHGYFVASGSSGQGVKTVQQKVGANADGKFGSQTKAKVAAYQKSHGLVVDGVVGRQTASALLGKKNASSVKVGTMTAQQAAQLGAKVPGQASAVSRLRRSLSKSTTTTTHRKARVVKPSPHVGGGILVG